MRVSGFTTNRPNGAGTRTYESFSKFLGARPERMGIMSKYYEDFTITSLTEGIGNVYTKDSGKDKSLRSINSFLLEWGLQSTRIERVTIVKAIEGDGCNKSEVKFYFDKAWYNINDVFVVEKTRQQFIVVAQPVRINDKCNLVIAKIQDNDYNSVVADAANLVGATTRYISNVQPELHERGFCRVQSNVEQFRTYINTIRCDVDASAQYVPMEDTFIQIGKGNGSDKDPIYMMEGAEKVCLDSFMEARNNALLWNKTNVDANGKPTIYDEIGRP